MWSRSYDSKRGPYLPMRLKTLCVRARHVESSSEASPKISRISRSTGNHIQVMGITINRILVRNHCRLAKGTCREVAQIQTNQTTRRGTRRKYGRTMFFPRCKIMQIHSTVIKKQGFARLSARTGNSSTNHQYDIKILLQIYQKTKRFSCLKK